MIGRAMKKEEWHHKLYDDVDEVLALPDFGLITWGGM